MTLPQGIPPSSKGRRSQTLAADSGAGEEAEGRPCSLGPAREPGCWTTANVAAAGTLGEAHWPGSGFDIPPEAAAPVPAACISLLVLLRQIHRWAGLNGGHLFSHGSGGWKYKTTVWHSRSPVGTFLLACRQTPSRCDLLRPVLDVCAHTELGVPSCFHEDTGPVGQGHTFMALLNLHYVLRGPSSEYSHTRG